MDRRRYGFWWCSFCHWSVWFSGIFSGPVAVPVIKRSRPAGFRYSRQARSNEKSAESSILTPGSFISTARMSKTSVKLEQDEFFAANPVAALFRGEFKANVQNNPSSVSRRQGRMPGKEFWIEDIGYYRYVPMFAAGRRKLFPWDGSLRSALYPAERASGGPASNDGAAKSVMCLIG